MVPEIALLGFVKLLAGYLGTTLAVQQPVHAARGVEFAIQQRGDGGNKGNFDLIGRRKLREQTSSTHSLCHHYGVGHSLFQRSAGSKLLPERAVAAVG